MMHAVSSAARQASSHVKRQCVGLADIPLSEAVAGVRVGFTDEEGIIVNPTVAQMSDSRLDLVLAGTADKLLMVEGFCDFLTDGQMQEVCMPRLSTFVVKVHMAIWGCASDEARLNAEAASPRCGGHAHAHSTNSNISKHAY